MKQVANISVDVDGLDLYYQIHGLTPSPTAPSIYETGVVRFLNLFAQFGIKATFFVVAKDALISTNRAILERAVEEGHEIASHSQTHPYDLVRQSPDAIERELSQAEEILSDIRKGVPVAGFRAPGYNTSPVLLKQLSVRGYRYDSSFFPCPPYYLAKAGYLAMYRLLQRPSQSCLGHPRVLWSSRHPHRLAEYGNLLEFPMTVTPGLRIPVIGTSLISMGKRGWKWIAPMIRKTPFVQIEFHGIDMTDHHIDKIDDALLRQPDQRVSLEAKQELFEDVFRELSKTRTFHTLEELSSHPEWVV
jgi:predicted deacetylase